MKTDALIAALAADVSSRPWSTKRALAVAMGLGGGAAAVVLVFALGVRPDLLSALATWRFDLKLALAAAAVMAAVVDCYRQSRPVGPRGVVSLVGYVWLCLAASAALELWLIPQAEWTSRLVGTDALLCLVAIPALAVAPLVALLRAMRTGAPQSPARAGRAAGILAGAIAALFYAAHCVDDSPVFVAVWYPLAISAIAAVGTIAGLRRLSW